MIAVVMMMVVMVTTCGECRADEYQSQHKTSEKLFHGQNFNTFRTHKSPGPVHKYRHANAPYIAAMKVRPGVNYS
jgi:hypothetical protein